jgi:murein DD-endopeptidase MepM/ murein hydrolase activator NlpD
METYIKDYCEANQAKVAYGGYNEIRSLYERSQIFQEKKTAERNIHIGLDLWLQAGSEVFAPVEGYIHSFKNNKAAGDYGPTIIIEHHSKTQTWYTLYGHLSLESLKGLKIGKYIEKGKSFATLGKSDVNGNYAPHLHFQIIKNIINHSGDYPGVCAKVDLPYYLENCPDPKILLGLE